MSMSRFLGPLQENRVGVYGEYETRNGLVLLVTEVVISYGRIKCIIDYLLHIDSLLH